MVNKNCQDGGENRGIIGKVKEYIHSQIDLLKINIIEKASYLVSFILVLVVGSLIIFSAIAFLSMAVVYWLSTLLNSMILALLIMGGFYILLFVVFYLLRNKIFLNFAVKKICTMFFSNPKSSSKNE